MKEKKELERLNKERKRFASFHCQLPTTACRAMEIEESTQRALQQVDMELRQDLENMKTKYTIQVKAREALEVQAGIWLWLSDSNTSCQNTWKRNR